MNTVVSVVVPAWRGDRDELAGLLDRFNPGPGVEVIVALPADEAAAERALRTAHPHVRVVLSPRGRAVQMNAGAAVAVGDWIVFLHADSRLPDGWRSAIEAAAANPRIAGGSFRFHLESDDWRARVIEFGVRLRVMSLGVPYGDQALFVRRSTFEAIGGFADLPLMEDVDLVRRLNCCGTLLHSPLPVSTSARRWEHDGWVRRTAQNWRLASSYVLGVPPAALARRYLGRRRIAVAVMARAPWLPGKTRLAAAGLTAEDHADLRGRLFDDTVDALKRVAGVDRYVACEPADACEAMRARVGEGIDVIAQHGGDLGSRMHGAAADLFRLGAAGAILIGSDLPDLPTDVIADAARALDRRGDRLVLGPAGDGGYYLVGLKAPHPELFDRLDWGTGTVFDQTLARARAAGVDVHLVSSWRDVDRWEDLLRLQTAETMGAMRTRSWLWSRREVS